MRFFKHALKRMALMSILFLVIFLVSSCERVDWYRALKSNTIDNYEYFMRKYNHSPRLMEASQKLKELRFEEAKKINSIPAYQKFLKRYSYGQYVDSAKVHIELLAFENARRINNIPVFQEFYQHYRPIFHADLFRNVLDQLYSQRYPDFLHVQTARVVVNKTLGENGVLNDFINLPFETLIKDIMLSNGVYVTFENIGHYDMLLTVDVKSTVIKSEEMSADSVSSYGISFDMNFKTQTDKKESISFHTVSNYFPKKQLQHVSLASQSSYEAAFWQIGSYPTCLSTLLSQCFGTSGVISLLDNDDKIRPHIIQSLISIDAPNSDFFPAQLREIDKRNMAIASVLVQKDDVRVTPFLVEVLHSGNSELQMEAMKLLQTMPDTTSINPLIYLTNQRKDRKLRLRAIQTLGYIHNKKCTDYLVHLLQERDQDLLQERDQDIQKAAVVALGNHKNPTAVSALITMFNNEEREVANQAMDTLTKLGSVAVDSLIQALHSKEVSTVWRAMVVLGELRAERAISDIIPLLNHSNEFTSWKAREVLGQFKNEEIVTAMIDSLNITDMKEKAAAVLGYLGNVRAVQPLIASYNSETDFQTKYAIIGALGKFDVPLATDLLIDILNSDQIVLQNEAVKALGKIGDPRALPVLEKWYQMDNSSLKISILEAYGGYQQPKQTQRLLQALNEDNSELREKAVEMLGGIVEKSNINELIYQLNDPSRNVQNAAKNALLNVGEVAIPSMSKILQNHDDRNLRTKIIYVLKDMQSEQAVPSLIAVLNDPDPYFIANAKAALQSLGEPAVSALLDLIISGNMTQRIYAADILAKIQEPRALPLLLNQLNKLNNELKISTASLMGDLHYFPAVSLLISYLDERDTGLVIEATKALSKIGSPEAAPSLLKNLDSQNISLAVESAKALGRIKDSRAIASLIEKSKSNNVQIKNAAIEALVSIGAPAVEPLISLMSDPNHLTVAEAADILARIGSSAVPGLLTLLKDTSTTSWYAAAALGKIKDKHAIEPLIKALVWDDEYFYEIIKTALSNIGKPAFEPVARLMQSDIANQRWKAIEVMYAFREPSMIKYFIAALDDKDWRVRFAAAKALHDISGKKF